MKPSISLVVALATAGIVTNCMGAAAIYLNNYDLDRPIIFCVGPSGVVKAPIGTTILISGGVPGAAFTPLGPEFGLTEPGYFDNGFGNVWGVADNANVDLMLEAEYVKEGTVYRTIAAWSQQAGANPGAPTLPTPAMLELPPNLTLCPWCCVVPEPSTTALTLLGGGVLLWLFRRK